MQHIIELTPFYISFLWGVVFLLNPLKTNRARFGLGIFMITTSVVYLSHAVYFEGEFELYRKMDPLYALAGLSVWPMYYLYIRLLTRDVNFKTRYLLHLLPAITITILLETSFQFAAATEKEAYINIVLIHNKWPGADASAILKTMAAIFFTGRIVFGIQVFVYLILGYRLVRKYNERIANFYSNVEGKQLVWVELLTISLLITAVVSSIANFLGRSYFLENNLLFIPSIIFSILLFIIGLQGNKQDHNITDVVYDEGEGVKLNDPRIDKTDLKEKLITFMDKEQSFLDPNFRITTLCSKLYTNRTYLSNLINDEFEMSFSDFINQYRIKFAKELMSAKKNSNYSINHFSEEAGFGSVSSFNRAFKQFEGITVGEYRKKIKMNL
ncbi:MAG: helix-turn-helix domain-containing protein [Bacteroidetes bacterium]|nr:helix-turn-helix domain-containing protein [Bacteroidota bacterium]